MGLRVTIELSDDDVAAIAPLVEHKAVLGSIAWRERIRQAVADGVTDWLTPLRYDAEMRRRAVLAQLERKETE